MTKRISSVRTNAGSKVGSTSNRNDAQMAFSMVAIVILLISGIAVTMITSNTIDSSSSKNKSPKAMEMEEVSVEVERYLSDSAYIIGLNVLNNSFKDDPKALQSLFQDGIQSSIDSNFPSAHGACVAKVESYSISLAQMPAAGFGGHADALDSHTSNIIAFFRVCGIAELNISCSQGQLRQNISIDRSIFFPQPLLEGAWDRFGYLIQDDGSMLWKMVRYEITALVQMRLYQNTFTLNGPVWSSEVLTEVDIQNAMVLSTMILQRAVFCTFDESLMDRFISPSGYDIFPNDVLPLIEAEGTADPADLFLILYGMDSIDVRSLIAQSLYASADLIALRLLEYLRVADIINSIEEVVQAGVFNLKDAISFVLGKDVDNDNARCWVGYKFDGAGIDEDVYRYIWNDNLDWQVSIPSLTMALMNDTGGYEKFQIGGEVGLDVPTMDILRSDLWNDFSREYELATNELIGSIVEMVKRVSTEISFSASIGPAVLDLDPFDGVSVFEELIESVSFSLEENEGFFGCSSNTIKAMPFQDPMGASVFDSIEQRTDDFYRMDDVIENAYDELAKSVYEDLVAQNPSLDKAPYELNIGTLREAFRSGTGSNMTGQLEQLFRTDTKANMMILKEGLTSPSGSSISFWDNVLSALVSGQVMNSIGMEPWIEDNLLHMLEDMATSNDIKGGPIEIQLNAMDSLIVTNANRQSSKIMIHLQTEIFDGLRISISDPIENQEGRLNPNQHITDLIDGSLSPFVNCWSYIVEGRFNMELSIRQDGNPLLVQQSYDGFTFIDTNTNIVASTGWPMDLVDYEPTNTLDQDTMSLITDIWDEFTEMFRSLGKTVSSSYDMLKSIESGSADIVSKVIEIAGEVLQDSIVSLQEFIREMILKGVCAMIESLTNGRNVQLLEMEMMGTHLRIELNSKDPALSGSDSIVKASIGFTTGGCSISISSRLFRDPAGEYSFLVNASLRSEQMKLAMVIDPFMSSYSHIMEIRGWLGSHYVDICMPEIVRYKQVGFSLADLPGIGTILSNIPLPIPGMKGQINAGIIVKLATDSTSGPVINEFELNPKGRDSGNEWVEIFNPTGEVISLSGWTIETMHGRKAIDDLGEILLMPHSRFVYEFKKQALDNGGTGCLPEGESLVLRDATGRRIDTAPFVPDVKNDARTWQRAHDGSETWEFRTGSKGEANSETISRWVSENDVGTTLEAIIVQTFELLEASGSSLSSLGNALETSMMNAITTLTEEFAGAIIEVGLFIEMSIVEGSGSIGATLRYSLSTDGSILEESWGWLCSTIMDMTSNPMSAMQAIGRSGLPDFIYENVWFGASSGIKMKAPLMLGASQSFNCKMASVVKVNIAATGILIGKDMGTSKMTFGICMTGIMSDNVPLLGLQAGQQVDVWLIKGTMISQ